MAPPFRLTADFEVLTPMFLGGADPNRAELRAPSLKGAMRFWYRALDPHFHDHEPLIFGTAGSGGGEGAGQSLLIVRCHEGDRAGERMTFADAKPEQFNQGSGRQTTNGLVYLGYPFGMGNNKARSAFVPGARFSVEVICRRAWKGDEGAADRPLQAALASVWALGHLGALGSRARRGFGALALTGWSLTDLQGQPLQDAAFAALPLLAQESGHSAWEAGARRAIETMRRWFGPFNGKTHHPHLGPKSDLVVRREGFKREWRQALLSLGKELQGFRQRRQPDYDRVKDHVLSQSKEGGQPIRQMPERAVFGLPLAFRFGSLPRGRPVTFAPVQGERHGSPLLLRPVLAGGQLHAMFLRLSGDVPGMDAGVRGTGRSLPRPQTNLLDDFMRKQRSEG